MYLELETNSWLDVKKDPLLNYLYPAPPRIALKRNRSLRDMLVRARLKKETPRVFTNEPQHLYYLWANGTGNSRIIRDRFNQLKTRAIQNKYPLFFPSAPEEGMYQTVPKLVANFGNGFELI